MNHKTLKLLLDPVFQLESVASTLLCGSGLRGQTLFMGFLPQIRSEVTDQTDREFWFRL